MKKCITLIAGALMISACNNSKTESGNNLPDSLPTDSTTVEMKTAEADTATADTIAAVEPLSDRIARSTPIKFTGSKRGTEYLDGQKVTYTCRATLTLKENGKCTLYEMVQDDMTTSGTYSISDSTIVMTFPNRWDGKTVTGTISSDLSKITLKKPVAEGVKTLKTSR